MHQWRNASKIYCSLLWLQDTSEVLVNSQQGSKSKPILMGTKLKLGAFVPILLDSKIQWNYGEKKNNQKQFNANKNHPPPHSRVKKPPTMVSMAHPSLSALYGQIRI